MMLKLRNERKTFYVGIADEQAIVTIKDRYGVHSDSDAVRLALRLTAESPMAQLPKKQNKTRANHE